MANYDWRYASRLQAFDPTEVHAWLEQVRKRGAFTPAAVRQAAMVKSSPLHQYFTWDKDEAAEHYQLGQASQVLSSLITTDGNRVYVVVERRNKRGSIYAPFSAVERQQSFRKAQIIGFYDDLERIIHKYGFLHELQGQLKLLATLRPKTARRAAS